MKIAGVVILFNPDEKVLFHLSSYASKVGHLYIFDNSPTSITTVIQWASLQPNCSYHHDGNNEGIAVRLNAAAKNAIASGYDWLLTMDQDSYFEEAHITTYLECLLTLPNKDITAMVGVEFIETEKGDLGTYCLVEEVDHLITSGSCVNLALFFAIKGFDEALFIDEVDLEYCYHAKAIGYHIVKLPHLFLHHSLGSVNYYRSFKSLKKTARALHSPLRVYYMVRNYLYVAKLYPKMFIESEKIRRGTLLNRIKNNLLYGEERWKVFVFIITAYQDFKANKMGKKI